MPCMKPAPAAPVTRSTITSHRPAAPPKKPRIASMTYALGGTLSGASSAGVQSEPERLIERELDLPSGETEE